ncbi:MAG: hypothetical protein RMJ19_03035 [Gemmatales bacterium]|nr:hypothetical protein [Gemmatales bacterium]MDW8174622.1 hypothetical protein [Gemmatales bacterium]MDW8221930.1 hypothetical protein [Gemmatales bacterium]
MTDVEKIQQRAREFQALLPLILELAGLPRAEPGRYFTPEQLEARAVTIRHAYKVARQLVNEIVVQGAS